MRNRVIKLAAFCVLLCGCKTMSPEEALLSPVILPVAATSFAVEAAMMLPALPVALLMDGVYSAPNRDSYDAGRRYSMAEHKIYDDYNSPAFKMPKRTWNPYH